MRLPPPGPRRTLLLALTFAVIAAAFRLPRLGMPHVEVFDEVYHAKTAQQYLDGERPLEWVHPPTSKLLIAVGVKLGGYHAWAWRLAPAFAGILLAPVFFLLARTALRSERGAILATVLLLCDGVYFVQSRIAMTNIFAVLFQVSAALFLLRAVLPERLGARDMLLGGLCLGLALSTRWTSLWATGFLGLVVVVARRFRIYDPRELGLVATAFVAIPAAVYTLSYVPWMLIVMPGGTWSERIVEMVHEQGRVWTYHATLNATHPYFSAWYTWPWLVRPTWYYYYAGSGAGDFVRGVIALGNPALWWLSVPVTLWALSSGLADMDPRRLFSGAGFCLLYLPWALSPRTLNFSHYLFEAIPYACLSLGVLLDRHWDGEAGAVAARTYLLIVALLFLFLLPVLTALPIPPEIGLRPWAWFRTWI